MIRDLVREVPQNSSLLDRIGHSSRRIGPQIHLGINQAERDHFLMMSEQLISQLGMDLGSFERQQEEISGPLTAADDCQTTGLVRMRLFC